MPAVVNLKALGLNTSPNQLDIAEGSLTTASNVVIKRDGIIEPRRGFKLYGNGFPSASDRAKQLLIYKNKILRHFGTTLQVDTGNGSFVSLSGNYTEQETGYRIRSLEQNGNLYFTTSEGIKKLSSATDAEIATSIISQSGGVKALDGYGDVVVTLGDSSGFMAVDSAVAYRAVWGIRDANNNLILGTPSSRVEIYSPLMLTLVQDFVRLLNALDLINQAGSLITDGNYVSTLKLTTQASADQLQANLLSLATKIDEDIKLAGSSAPLTIGSATISAGVCTVVFSSGDPTLYVDTGSNIFLKNFVLTGTGSVNGAQVVSTLNSTQITFNTAATGTITVGSASIESNEYRSITQPPVPSVPALHDDLVDLQTYIEAIITQLQEEPNAIISSGLQSTYLTALAVTSTVNTKVSVVIPEDVTENHFLQLYRSEVITASTGQSLTTDVVPSDELRLVYEAFPTESEFSLGLMEVVDVAPDSFRAANLYTNAISGEGIIQANDIPPFAKDIGSFKNHAFYANTRTKGRYNAAFLGVQKLITDYNNGITPELVIANQNRSSIYRFILGASEVTDVTTVAGSLLNASGTASYFTINSTDNQYYVWYKIGTSTDPAISGKTGIEVAASASDTATQIASKTVNALSLKNSDFGVSSVGAVITVTNLNIGYVLAPTVATSGFTISITTAGKGQKVQRETSTITTVADVAGSLSGLYFLLSTAEDQQLNYVWYRVNGTGTDPLVANRTGIIVDINSNDSATVVADKTVSELNDNGYVASNIGAVMTVASETYGPSSDAGAGTSGFTVVKVQDGALEVLLSNVVSPSQAVDETARSLVDVINKNNAEIVYAYYLSGPDDTPGLFLLEAKSLDEPNFYLLANNASIGSSFSPDLSPSLTISSIATGNPNTMLITTPTPHGLVNLDTVVISGTNSTPNIDGYYAITYVSPTTFRVNRTVTVAGTAGSLISTKVAEVSSNEEKVNRVYYSKLNQPEAVPILNYFDVGASNKQILRIVPLRDSLFVFKEDGLYRISGETIPFNLALFDSTMSLLAPDSIGITNNAIYCWASEGISTVTESGASVISRPIDDQILRLGSSQFTNFKTATFGLGYDSDNGYYVFTVKQTGDTVATICYRYSTLTESWTTFDKTNTCGIVGATDDVLYLGAGDTNFIEQERKSFTRLDYADREISKTLTTTGYQGATIQLDVVTDIKVGDVIFQEQLLTVYEFNMLLLKLDSDPGVADTDYYSTLVAVGGDNLRTKIQLLATKLDADTGVASTNYANIIASKSGSISSISVASPTVITTSAPHGLENGRIVLVSGSNSSPVINGEYEVTVLSSTTFSVDVAVTSPGTSGSFITSLESFEDVKASYNAIIANLNLDAGVAFSNYTPVDTTTEQEAVVLSISKPTKSIVLNQALDFIAGPLVVYKSIQSVVEYSPTTMGDALSYKHIREATMMFANKAFTQATMSFATDLLPEYVDVTFNGDGNGIFGIGNSFGSGFFGGASHGAPFRTYVPRNCQRCRFLLVKFSHSVARENYLLYGISLTGAVGQSSRAYR
jgi:hypothetical protein